MLAAHETDKLELGTGIAVAFARNPMNIAVAAQDLNVYSGGRFRLGLGSQIKPHITRRFSMPWHGAAKQMREFIASGIAGTTVPSSTSRASSTSTRS